MRTLLILLISILSFSCSKGVPDADTEIFVANNISENIAKIVSKRSLSTEQLLAYDTDFNEVKVEGVILKVKASTGKQTTIELREELTNFKSQAYLYDNSYGFDHDLIAIVNTKIDSEYLQIVRTDGVNYDINAEKVLEKFLEWDSKYDLELIGAGRSWLEASVHSSSVNWKIFAQYAYEFCPDIVDQGTGTLIALEAEMKNSKSLFLWWD